MRYLSVISLSCMIMNALPATEAPETAASFVANISSSPFMIPAETVRQILERDRITVEQLLERLIPVAQSYSRSPISNFKVGVAALGKSGAIYLGTNLEFPNSPLNATVHGEQFLIVNARNYGETGFTTFTISAAPCGHCRQFLNEMFENEDVKILFPKTPPQTIDKLLPYSFGRMDLNSSEETTYNSTELDQNDELLNRARLAAVTSYAPHTKAKSGVAIQTKDGRIYSGSYLENAAYNPSLSPLQSALVAFVADMRGYNEIQKIVLVEPRDAKISHEVTSREIVKTIAPEAEFSVVHTDD